MSETQLAAPIIIVSTLVPCLGIAYLIGVKQQRQWLAGFDDSEMRDPEGYARAVALGIVLMALLISLSAILFALGVTGPAGMGVLILMASFTLIPCLVVAKKKYKKRQA